MTDGKLVCFSLGYCHHTQPEVAFIEGVLVYCVTGSFLLLIVPVYLLVSRKGWSRHQQFSQA